MAHLWWFLLDFAYPDALQISTNRRTPPGCEVSMPQNTGDVVEKDGAYVCTTCGCQNVYRAGERFGHCYACDWAGGWTLEREIHHLPPERPVERR